MKKSNWIIFFINGLIAILFGLLALLVPRETIFTLIIYFGVIILLAGLILFYFSFQNLKAKRPYLLLMFEAFLAVLAGAIITFYPGSSMKVFLTLIGIWATIMGLVQIIVAVQMKKKVSHHSLFTINGVITLVFGLLLFFNPMGSIKVLFVIIGLMALVAGVLLVYLGLKIKGIKNILS